LQAKSGFNHLVTAPSSKTLVVLACLCFLATVLLIPGWYPAATPVIGSDGSVMHGLDGKILVQRDMIQFNKEAIPGEICFLCTLILVGWLLIRLFRFAYIRYNKKSQ
jgi:hypothetical protein